VSDDAERKEACLLMEVISCCLLICSIPSFITVENPSSLTILSPLPLVFSCSHPIIAYILQISHMSASFSSPTTVHPQTRSNYTTSYHTLLYSSRPLHPVRHGRRVRVSRRPDLDEGPQADENDDESDETEDHGECEEVGKRVVGDDVGVGCG